MAWIVSEGKVECPSCDGFGDHGVEEESGCRYVCYVCGMAGVVSPEVAAEYRAGGYPLKGVSDAGDEERALRYAESGEAGKSSFG